MSTFQLAVQIVERCLLSLVAIFAATIAIGITQEAHTSDTHPRTVHFYNADHGAAVESVSPVTSEGAR